MIQFNLLPDVKLDYIKAERSKRLVVTVAVITCLASIVILVLMYAANLAQKKHLSDLSKDITKSSQALQNNPDINTVLTIQNQLEQLTHLHDSKPAAFRIFDYLNNLTPASVSITNFSADFTKDTITITGSADALSSVNQYVDTLKLTTYTTTDNQTPAQAFNNVVLSSFAVNSGSKDASQAATYTVTLSYDKNIFDNTQTPTLSIPSVTTRAQLQNAQDLFKNAPTPPSGSKQ